MGSGSRPPLAASAGAGAAELFAALEQLQADGDGAHAALLHVVEQAVLDTYRRLVADEPGLHVRIDGVSGAVELWREADGHAAAVHVEDPDFQRQAAQAARAAVSGWRRDQERERVVREATAHRGELIDVVVERLDGVASVRAPRFAAVLPPEEQLAGEHLQRQQHLKVVVIDVRRRARDAQVVVSRSHPLLLRRLLEQEVPELADGRVVVKGIAREAARRSKVAVYSPHGGVDAQGACIGPRGVRIRAVISQLNDEQVQVVEWSPDPAAFVAAALAPARVLAVDLDQGARTAHVVVPDDQLSLAIGRSGENARLAARLTGWRIDIAGESGHPERERRAAGPGEASE